MRKWLASGWAFWLGVFASTWLVSTYARDVARALDARWIIKYPAQWRVPLKREISDWMKWLVEDASFGLFTFKELTRGIAAAIDVPYQFALATLTSGFQRGIGQNAVEVAPPLSWIAVIAAVVALGHYAGGWRLAGLVGACFLYLAVFGQWDSAMVTLASILIAVPIGAVGGLLLGIAAYRWRSMDAALRPVLDLMQTVPVFAYLVPILFLFGFGPVAALVATIVYAMPPMVRVTTLSLRAVPPAVLEAGMMAGSTRGQLMWKVLVPSASNGIMVGVNQVIMLSLNMVIIASMIGAGGLGYDVLTALRRLDIGGGLEAGFAIVVLAIALDRLSQAFATRSRIDQPAQHSWLARHPWLATVLVVAVVTTLIGLIVPAFREYPVSLTITTGDFLDRQVEWINVNYFDEFEAAKTFMLTHFLLPVKRFLSGVPWLWGVPLMALLGWRFGGWRLAALCGLLSLFVAANGLWAKAMITVYLCGISVVVASLIGIPIGIAAAQNARINRVVNVAVDTLQTLPSFVYLIPVVMLFRVGDFAAMIAVVLYALAPAIRYAALGVRSVDPQLVEAGIAAGATRGQLLRKIKLPIAAPELLLGLNQTIMLALSMLVITALVGTRDLGQEVYIALTKADTGRGIVAGLCVAFIAIIADRICSASARRMRERLDMS